MDEIKTTLGALEKNNFKGYPAEDAAGAKELVMSMIKKDDVVGAGGSMTLEQCGIKDELRKKGYNFLDWSGQGLSQDEKTRLRKQSLTCDVFLSSTNAVTEDGMLYNVDGYGNRVAGITYGPDRVIIVAGRNKIVKNLEEARKRLRTVAGPLNARRLKKDTPCVKTGECMDCDSPDRICRHTVITDKQKPGEERISVIIVDEDLGL